MRCRHGSRLGRRSRGQLANNPQASTREAAVAASGRFHAIAPASDVCPTTKRETGCRTRLGDPIWHKP